MHCIITTFGFISITKLKVFSTSQKSAAPVLIIIGLPNLATFSISGKVVRSPEAILKQFSPISFRKSALFKSKGVAKNVILFFDEYQTVRPSDVPISKIKNNAIVKTANHGTTSKTNCLTLAAVIKIVAIRKEIKS